MNDEIITILQIVDKNPIKTAEVVANELGITRQTASRKLKKLIDQGVLKTEGSARAIRYKLIQKSHCYTYKIGDCREDVAYREILQPLVKHLDRNVIDILHYGFTEMFNNAIDHSDGSQIDVEILTTPIKTEVNIQDNGLGIFEKIQKAFDLVDIRQSIFELSKGKLTTDSKNHSGEGIFFSSKIFDFFCISSKDWAYVHNEGVADIMYEQDVEYIDGTKVYFALDNFSSKKLIDVFNQFANTDELAFAATIVPIHLAKYEGESLMSRSQAKRLTARFERFQKVILDFQGVSIIGQGFADELFRVYQNAYPNVLMIPTNMVDDVKKMISHVLASQ